ncbi:MAG TPA: hypothetical protein VKP58_11540 [Candidatus Acidoferrum sp.]|nr:hypothetical protein [Candidatus Acidoferrum sp.]
MIDDPRNDHNSEGKSHRVVRAKKIAKAINIVTVAVCVWGYFLPRPYAFAVLCLIALPSFVLIIGFRSRKLYNIDGHKNDARPSLAYGFIFPTCVLALLAIRFNYVGWAIFPVLGSCGGAIIAYVAHANQPATVRRRQSTIAYLLLGSMYCWAALAAADAAFDFSPERTFSTTVLTKHISHGKSTTYYVFFGAVGPHPNGRSSINSSHFVLSAQFRRHGLRPPASRSIKRELVHSRGVREQSALS